MLPAFTFNHVQLPKTQQGDSCCVYWTGDKRWFRAVVKAVDIDEGTIQVYNLGDKSVCTHDWNKNRWGIKR